MDNILQQGKEVYLIPIDLIVNLVEGQDIVDIAIFDNNNREMHFGSSSETKNGKSAFINKEYYINETTFKSFNEFGLAIKQYDDDDNKLHVISVDDVSPKNINWDRVTGIKIPENAIKVFCKKNIIRVSQLAIPFSILYFGLMIIASIGTFDSVIESIFGFVFGIIVDIVIYSFVFWGNRKFAQSIKDEEAKHNVIFQVENLKKLSWKIYLSDDWLIVTGKFALHKNSVKSIEKKKAAGLKDDGLQYIIIITENDNLSIKVDEQSDVTELIKWCKQ